MSGASTIILLERTWLGASKLSFTETKSCGPNGILGPMYVINSSVPPFAEFNWKWDDKKLFEVKTTASAKG